MKSLTSHNARAAIENKANLLWLLKYLAGRARYVRRANRKKLIQSSYQIVENYANRRRQGRERYLFHPPREPLDRGIIGNLARTPRSGRLEKVVRGSDFRAKNTASGLYSIKIGSAPSTLLLLSHFLSLSLSFFPLRILIL